MTNNKQQLSIWRGVAIFLAAALLLGIILGVVFWQRGNIVFKSIGEEQAEELPKDEGGAVIGESVGSGVKLMSAKIATADYAANGISPMAETAYTLTATITPSTADNKAVDWSVAWVDPSSSWASGKTVTDYVTVTPTSDGALTANAECLQAFGEQIKITVTSRANTYASASCTVDYARKILDFRARIFTDDGVEKDLHDFGESQIMLEMKAVPYSQYKSADIWVGNIGASWITDFDVGDPEEDGIEIFDPEIAEAYKFSDYTIKDNLIYTLGDNEYAAEIDVTYEFDQDFELLCASFYSDYTGYPSSFSSFLQENNVISNNPVSLLEKMGPGSSGLNIYGKGESFYNEWQSEFISYFKELNGNPYVTMHVSVTGKYSSFEKDIKISYDPSTIQMPVSNVTITPSNIVF